MAAPFVSAAQTRPDNDKQDRVMTVKEMKHDINYYFKTLRDIHPHPYAHYTKAQMDSVEKALYKHCSKPLPFSEFAYQLYKTKKYVDEHTGIDYNISLTEEQYANFFPLTTIEKGNIMLGENVIHTINGISSSKILNELDLLFSWERHLFYYPTSYVWYEKEIPNREGFLLPDIPYSLDKLLEVEDYKEIIRLSDEMGL